MSFFKRKPKHQHQWTPKSVSFLPPVKGGFEVSGFASTREVNGWLYGVTILVQQCECGKITTEDFIGQVDIPGFEWKEKKK